MPIQKLLKDLSIVEARVNDFVLLKKLTKDFSLIHNTKENVLYIASAKLDLLIKVKSKGYIPKSGFFLIDSISSFNLKGKKAIDIGCGETGIIAHYLLSKKAKVSAIDIDIGAIEHAKDSSNVSGQISWHLGNYQNLSEKYDIITSNPPQMPMPKINREMLKDFHDSPGETGREMIEELLVKSSSLLEKNGVIFMLIFDFLGVKKSYNNAPSIEEFANNYGLSCEIINAYQKTIAKGGQTEKNISWIKNSYPDYKFKSDKSDNLYFDILAVKFTN